MDDIRRSLKTKTEIERQSNKRRQRSLKSGDLGMPCRLLGCFFARHMHRPEFSRGFICVIFCHQILSIFGTLRCPNTMQWFVFMTVNDTSDPIEMKRLQREMDSILDPSSAHSSLGTPSPRLVHQEFWLKLVESLLPFENETKRKLFFVCSHEIDDPKGRSNYFLRRQMKQVCVRNNDSVCLPACVRVFVSVCPNVFPL